MLKLSLRELHKVSKILQNLQIDGEGYLVRSYTGNLEVHLATGIVIEVIHIIGDDRSEYYDIFERTGESTQYIKSVGV